MSGGRSKIPFALTSSSPLRIVLSCGNKRLATLANEALSFGDIPRAMAAVS